MYANRYLPFIGRLLIGLPFLVSGLSKLAAYGPTTAFIATSALPLPPPLSYAGAVAVEIGCGLLVIAGFRTRVAATVLALFCLPLQHSFTRTSPIPTRYSTSSRTW